MPFNRDDFATLEITLAIFHDLPRQWARPDPEQPVAPVLSQAVTQLIEASRQHIRTKFVETLQSTKAYPATLLPEPTLVPASVLEYLSAPAPTTQDFIDRSRVYADHLFGIQGALMSAGLLCVVACRVNRRPAVGLMKIEREEGAQLELEGREGARTFRFEMLENLVFTKNTKLFKAGLFARSNSQQGDLDAMASDVQLGHMANYWLEFLGCAKARQPRVETKVFFDTVLQVLNRSQELSPVERNDAYEALVVEMRSRRRAIQPQAFIEDHVPPAIQEDVRRRLHEAGVPRHFDKDTADIGTAIRRKVLRTDHGIDIIVPERSENLVEVEEDHLTVRDPLLRVGRQS